jgi:4a-hydroxytetrahydrobiopterin dehydratase
MNQEPQNLTSKTCVACEGGIPPLTKAQAEPYFKEILGWEADEDFKQIKKTFKLPDFKEAVRTVDQVAELAEEEGHHPDIIINYNKVTFSLSTHAIGGLSLNDFILAAKIDKCLE